MTSSNSPSDTFIATMRKIRKSLGLTQAELAAHVSEHLGRTIDGPTMTRIETGQRPLKLDEAVAIAKVLQVPLCEMLPAEFTITEELAALEHKRAAAIAEVLKIDMRREEISAQQLRIEARLKELRSQSDIANSAR